MQNVEQLYTYLCKLSRCELHRLVQWRQAAFESPIVLTVREEVASVCDDTRTRKCQEIFRRWLRLIGDIGGERYDRSSITRSTRVVIHCG